MREYYTQNGITIYHGDCRELTPTLSPADVSLLLSDPPFGVAESTNRFSRGRSCNATCNDFPAVHGDAEPFDPSHLLRFPRLILFGANFYADKLPRSPSWLVWDKLNGLTSKRPLGFNDNGDCELAWTNLGGPVRLIPHRWMGMLKESEQQQKRVHPTQKPVALMRAIVEYWTEPGEMVFDPYMGGGSTLLAARETGRRAIGVEYEEQYCEAAARRLDGAGKAVAA